MLNFYRVWLLRFWIKFNSLDSILLIENNFFFSLNVSSGFSCKFLLDKSICIFKHRAIYNDIVRLHWWACIIEQMRRRAISAALLAGEKDTESCQERRGLVRFCRRKTSCAWRTPRDEIWPNSKSERYDFFFFQRKPSIRPEKAA